MKEFNHCSPGNSSLLLDKLPLLLESREAFELIKDDISTTVGILKGSAVGLSHNLLVKRFNYKGFFPFLVRLVFGSRASRLHKVSHEFAEKRLPVPKPFAYYDLTWKQRNSFFLSSVVENSISLAGIYLRGHFEPDKIAALLGRAVAELHTAGAVHGDLKWSNILLQEQEGNTNIYFIDLDQSKLYKYPKISGMARDLARFYRNGLELSAEDWVTNTFFPEYLAMLSPQLRDTLDIDKIKDRAYKNWRKKGARKKRMPS
jgi:tRNA A-37 threonylcarbamoyl transferase component Bud32